ncbi:MAG: hypothetical protein CVV10_07785 [Gammaproteobacteria bacterium HGW-Gammaproteobacteria-14]|nr:MAG: hypothetical protein CVV10_07785 [Gammaproteobacteria bacterium HGW-Gammaproteobacteria-14]
MAFDPRDVYDAAALYDMWLNCHSCTNTFDFEPNRPIGLDYYHDIGQRAKRDGWLVAEQQNDGADDAYMVLCPDCVSRYGLEVRHEMNIRIPPAIEEICRAMQIAEKERTAA